jgi:hypothetical protein
MWTYSGNPMASPVALVHYRLGDVNPENPLATDEECAQALLDNGNNSYLAAASVAETKAASFVYGTTMGPVGGGPVAPKKTAQDFLMLAQTLRLQASLRTASVYAGGLSEAEKEAARRDFATVQPFAYTRLHTRRPVPPSDETEWA